MKSLLWIMIGGLLGAGSGILVAAAGYGAIALHNQTPDLCPFPISVALISPGAIILGLLFSWICFSLQAKAILPRAKKIVILIGGSIIGIVSLFVPFSILYLVFLRHIHGFGYSLTFAVIILNPLTNIFSACWGIIEATVIEWYISTRLGKKAS